LATDSGNAGDGVTDTGTVNVSGLEASATWQFDIGNGWVSGSGTSFTLPEGRYPEGVIKVRQTDSAGNVSGVSTNTQDITVDATAPSSVTINSVVADRVLTNGGSTNDNTLVVSVSATDATDVSRVEIYNGSDLLGEASYNDTNAAWEFTTTALADGPHSLTAKAYDAAGNAATSAAFAVTV
ncbi:MAG: hypothetical protein DCO98_11500, partial [Altererythrobacter sp. XM-24bin4]